MRVHGFPGDPFLHDARLHDVTTDEGRVVHLTGFVTFDCTHRATHTLPVNVVLSMVQADELWNSLPPHLLAHELALANLSRTWVDPCGMHADGVDDKDL